MSTKSLSDTILNLVLKMPRIDTHGHFHGTIPELETYAISDEEDVSSIRFAPHRMMAVGAEVLYKCKIGTVLLKNKHKTVFQKARMLRQKSRSEIIQRALNAAHIETQFCFCDFRGTDANEKKALASDIKLLAYIDQALVGAPQPDDSYITGLERVHGPLQHIDDLLSSIKLNIDRWCSMGVVGMKVGIAYYDHGLALRDASYEETKHAFAKRNAMDTEDVRIVRDYALRYAFDLCVQNHLPIVIHTGFLAWGDAPLTNTNPALLQSVISCPRYHDAIFVLLHGGYPYVGETTFLAARYHNVVIDFTWLPWLSPTRFSSALMEWLENVPFSKFVWGSDSSITPESIVGIDRITRTLIGQTLQRAVSDGLLTRKQALRFIEMSYRENAQRIFGLNKTIAFNKSKQ